MQTVSVRTPTTRYRNFVRSPESMRAVKEFKTALLAPYRSLKYGAHNDTRLSRLYDDVNADNNRACFTVIDLLFGPQDSGVDLDTLCNAPSTLEALITARSPEAQELSMEDLHKMETHIEGALNDVQMAYVTGDNSTQCQLKLLAQIERNLAVLERMKARVTNNLYGKKQ